MATSIGVAFSSIAFGPAPPAPAPPPAGDVYGPASSTDKAVARFDGVTGKLLQNSAGVLDNAGKLTLTNSVDTVVLNPTGTYNSLISGANNLALGAPSGVGFLGTPALNAGDTAIGVTRIIFGSNSNADAYFGWSSSSPIFDLPAKSLFIRGAPALTGAVTNLNGGSVYLDSGAPAAGGVAGDIVIGNTRGNLLTVGKIIASAAIRLAGFTVATLPAGTAGDQAFVTDANTTMILAFGLPLVGTGGNVVPAFYDGTNWVGN